MLSPSAEYEIAAGDLAALPAATQRYIMQLHARAQEGAAVAALAWRPRFAEAHAYKVLKRAHAVVLQQLLEGWDPEQEGWVRHRA